MPPVRRLPDPPVAHAEEEGDPWRTPREDLVDRLLIATLLLAAAGCAWCLS